MIVFCFFKFRMWLLVLLVLRVEMLEVIHVVFEGALAVGQTRQTLSVYRNFNLVPPLRNLEDDASDLRVEMVFNLVVCSTSIKLTFTYFPRIFFASNAHLLPNFLCTSINKDSSDLCQLNRLKFLAAFFGFGEGLFSHLVTVKSFLLYFYSLKRSPIILKRFK